MAAADIASPLDVPPFARSAMDGYARDCRGCRGAHRADTPARLRIVERIFTGQMPRTAIVRGTCAEIATGAPLPEGADAVVMVEQTAARRRQTTFDDSRRRQRPGRTSGAAAPTSPPAPSCCGAATC